MMPFGLDWIGLYNDFYHLGIFFLLTAVLSGLGVGKVLTSDHHTSTVLPIEFNYLS